MYSNALYCKNSKNLAKISEKLWKSQQGVQQQHQNKSLQQPPKTTTGVPTITITQELICKKGGTTTISKFQQEIIPVLKKYIQNLKPFN